MAVLMDIISSLVLCASTLSCFLSYPFVSYSHSSLMFVLSLLLPSICGLPRHLASHSLIHYHPPHQNSNYLNLLQS